jgi:hypothetical protein
LWAASYCLSAAFVLAVATGGNAFAGPHDPQPGNLPAQAQGNGKPVAKPVLHIESMGARQFAGTTILMPNDPTNFQACDHGYVVWFIPVNARGNPHVFTHGSSIRGFQTAFDGQPGFQSILVGVSPEQARGAVRLSVGWFTTEEEVDRAASLLLEAWEAMHVL